MFGCFAFSGCVIVLRLIQDENYNAVKAIDYYNRGYANRKLKPFDNKGEHGTVELVTFKLVEVEDERKAE